jgi:hypothetical protein
VVRKNIMVEGCGKAKLVTSWWYREKERERERRRETETKRQKETYFLLQGPTS